jgi:hypothetical protein
VFNHSTVQGPVILHFMEELVDELDNEMPGPLSFGTCDLQATIIFNRMLLSYQEHSLRTSWFFKMWIWASWACKYRVAKQVWYWNCLPKAGVLSFVGVLSFTFIRVF